MPGQGLRRGLVYSYEGKDPHDSVSMFLDYDKVNAMTETMREHKIWNALVTQEGYFPKEQADKHKGLLDDPSDERDWTYYSKLELRLLMAQTPVLQQIVTRLEAAGAEGLLENLQDIDFIKDCFGDPLVGKLADQVRDSIKNGEISDLYWMRAFGTLCSSYREAHKPDWWEPLKKDLGIEGADVIDPLVGPPRPVPKI